MDVAELFCVFCFSLIKSSVCLSVNTAIGDVTLRLVSVRACDVVYRNSSPSNSGADFNIDE